MDQGQIALELMALYGKLRRAADLPTRGAIKDRINALLGQLRQQQAHPRLGSPRAERRPSAD